MQCDDSLPIFGTMSALTAELGDFIYDIRTYAVWGVANQISGPLDDAMFKEVMHHHRRRRHRRRHRYHRCRRRHHHDHQNHHHYHYHYHH